MTQAASTASPYAAEKVAGSRVMLITGIGSMSVFRTPHPNTTITAAGMIDFTSRIAERRLKRFFTFVAGFKRENFGSAAFGCS